MDAPAARDDDAPGQPEPTSPAEEALLRWPHQASPATDTPAGDERIIEPAQPREPETMNAPRAASPWGGRLVAAAAGAGLVLVGLALRDSSPMRRPAHAAVPPGWRRRVAAWLRGER